MTIQELMKKRNEVWNSAKSFVENHKNANGLMSADDMATYDKMEQEIHDYTREIERMQREIEIENTLSKATTNPIVERPMKAVEEDNKKNYRATKAYYDAMISGFRSKFTNVSDVLREGSDADGGYLVPDELERKIVEKLTDTNIVRKLATIVRTSGDHKINVEDSDAAASWIEEGGAISFGDMTWNQIILDAHKLHVAIKVTNELLEDEVFDLPSYITNKFADAISNKEEDAFLNGDGSHKPTGIFDATSGGTVSMTLATPAITADNIIDFIYKLKRQYRKKAAFIMNDATIAAIRKLKDNNGQFLWQPALQVGEPDRLLGYPLYTSPYCNKMEVGKPFMAFGDFSFYKIGDRGARSFRELRELFAGNDMTAFLAKERVDGKLVLPEAIQIMKVQDEETNAINLTSNKSTKTTKE